MVYDKWIMRQSSKKGASSSELLAQAKDLEAKFLTSLSARGVLDNSVRSLCSDIRDLYESVILSDHAFAEAQNVEHSLWLLHYRQIDDFRSLITADKEWSITHDGHGNAAFSNEQWRNFMQSKPALAGFRSFLIEASGFYHELLMKLRVSCGLALDLWDGVDYDKGKNPELKRCQHSCYRCLVNLGDYARYKEYYVGSDPSSYNFSIAADFYRQALAHWPVCGQPHNQLAVLAVYVKDELLAVYHYFRSLAVGKPFPTTRENLTILFEKNRVKYEELSPMQMKLSVPMSRKKSEGMKSHWVSKSPRRIPALQTERELVTSFFVRFVRLNGLFFTKTSLEKFEEVFSGVLYDLRELLALNDEDLELALGSGSCFGMAHVTHSAFGSIKLVIILICTMENVISELRNTETPKQSVLSQNASIALLAIVGHLVQRCAETQKVSESPLLPAVLVFFEWLSCRPDIVQGVDKEDEQFTLLLFIWKQFIKLLNRLSHKTKAKKILQDSKETRAALWEDFELQGFLPLSSSHVNLSYRGRPRESGTEITKDHQLRAQRLVAAGIVLASIAEESSLGLLFSQATTKCQLLRERKSDRNAGEIGKCGRPVETAVNPQTKDEAELHKEACRDDDDDEDELIVFRPTAKEQFVKATVGYSTAASDPTGDTACAFQNAILSYPPSLAALPPSSVSDGIETCSAPNPDCLPKSSTLCDASSVPCLGTFCRDTLKSDAMNLHSKEVESMASTDSLTEWFQQCNFPKAGHSSTFEQPTLGHFKRPSMQQVNGIEPSSSMGLRKSLGVIGQPKQIMTSMIETGDYVTKNSASLHDCVSPFRAVYPIVNSVSQKTPSLPDWKLSKEVQGGSHAGIAPKLAESALSFTSASFNQSSSLTGLVRGPPPGFGPRPTRNPPLGFSLWPDVHNNVICSGVDVLSSLPDEKQHGVVAGMERSVQVTSEKETWSLFGSTAGFNWNPSIFS